MIQSHSGAREHPLDTPRIPLVQGFREMRLSRELPGSAADGYRVGYQWAFSNEASSGEPGRGARHAAKLISEVVDKTSLRSIAINSKTFMMIRVGKTHSQIDSGIVPEIGINVNAF